MLIPVIELSLHSRETYSNMQRLAQGGPGPRQRRRQRRACLSNWEEFRQGRLTQPELRRLLGFATRQALDAVLKAHIVYMSYSLEDLEKDRDDLRRLGF